MTKQKKIFLALAVLFFLLLFYASWDISRRTTFPGSKGQLKERINKNYLSRDSISSDSARNSEK
jgi:hypothetical protein